MQRTIRKIALILLIIIPNSAISYSDQAEQITSSLPPLSPHSSNQEIADHLNWHETNRVTTTALSEYFPDMTRERSYEIQLLRMQQRSKSDPVVGWKLGFSRKAEPDTDLDTVFAPLHSSAILSNEVLINTEIFVEGTAALEPEVIIMLNADIVRGKEPFTREQISSSVKWVGAGIEFGASRLRPYGEEGVSTRSHIVADNISNAGIILPENKISPEDINWNKVIGTVTVNGQKKAEGRADYIMGRDPIEGVVWIANELHKYGIQLKSGQIIVTGSVDTPVKCTAGDHAEVNFSGLGSIKVKFAPNK